MKSIECISLASAVLLLTVGSGLRAADPAINPTGTWRVTVSSTNASARPSAQTLKLKLDGGTVAGTLSYNSGPVVNGKAPTSELPITEAKLKGNDISFNFSHPPAVGTGPNATSKYQGKITGDTIKGTFTTEAMGQTRTREWQAERLKK